MESSQPGLPKSQRPHRLRYLLDLILLVAVVEGMEFGLNYLPWPEDERLGMAWSLLTKIPLLLVAWLLVRLRGETLSDLGLKRPSSWPRTVLAGVGLAAATNRSLLILKKSASAVCRILLRPRTAALRA